MANRFETALECHQLANRAVPADLNGCQFFAQEIRDQAFLNIRGDLKSEEFIAALSTNGFQLPSILGSTQSVEQDSSSLLWISPDEFLIILPQRQQKATYQKLKEAFTGIHAAVIDLSGGYSMLELYGQKLTKILSYFAVYDFSIENFPVDKVVVSSWGKSLAIYRRRDENCIQALVRWSFADYCWRILLEAEKAEQ